MPGSFTREEREDAVERLVRMRIDREGGAGTYDDAMGRIAGGGSASPELQSAIERARERAERNIRPSTSAAGARMPPLAGGGL
jgi:hypothetical protein